MIYLASSEKCTGCMACYNSCNKQAIHIVSDEEGFCNPVIDDNKCIECGLCVKHCPVLSPIPNENKSGKVYAIINYTDRLKSSSGGAFSMIARWVLSKGGVVFGAKMGSDCFVKHDYIESVNNLDCLRGSKYVQSYIGESYKKVKEFLISGRIVLFTGTGCQVAGLYSYLNGKRYEEQLITLDLICHGVPSPGAFQAYLEKIKKSTRLKGEKVNIEGFGFRKLDSWIISPAVKFAETKEQILELSDNAYMSAFFKGLLFRESCYSCPHCNTNRVGTMTIADFWGIGKHGKRFRKSIASGVSLLIDNRGMIDQIKPYLKDTYIEERGLEEAMYEQDNLKAPMKRPAYRDKAVKDLINPNITLEEFCRIAEIPYQTSFINYLTSTIKKVLFKTGTYNLFLNVSYKIRN